jgi:hypothetical protein
VSDYLWDRSGPPDPDIERLERVLGTLRSTRPAPVWPAVTTRVERRGWSFSYLATAAALVAACAAGLWSIERSTRVAWPVVRVEGTPTVNAAQVPDAGRLAVGEWLETDKTSRATLAIGDVGRLDVEPESRLQLLAATTGNHRLSMAHGTVHAFIWAPPGEVFVETPASTVVDLGCAYTLTVDRAGGGHVEVSAGWVAFENHGRTALIPAGAVCAMRPGFGPGTPHYSNAPSGLQEALDLIDFGQATPEAQAEAVDRILGLTRPEDALTLWHLLPRVNDRAQDRVYDALAQIVPPPSGVTRAGIRADDRAMLDAWWDELGLGSSTWWKEWTRKEPQ